MNLKQATKMNCLAAFSMVTISFAACTAQAQSVSGAIADRYNQMGGASGPLGKVLYNQTLGADGRGQYNIFQNGMIALSPPTGPKSTQVIYRKPGQVVFQWGPVDPFGYDKFILRWTINNGPTTQIDVNGQGLSGDNYTAKSSRTDGTLTLNIGSKDSVWVIVEGADNGTFGVRARQGWTTPVWVGTPPGTAPSASTPAPPLLAVTSAGANATSVFRVTGSGFKPNSIVNIRVTDDVANTLYFSQTSGKNGQMLLQQAIPCNAGYYLYFSATDGRSNPKDATGNLWSNTVKVLCPGTPAAGGSSEMESIHHKSGKKIGALTKTAGTTTKNQDDITHLRESVEPPKKP